MSSHVGASGLNGSSRVGVCGTKDADKENDSNETCIPCSKTVRPRPGSANPAEEGRSSGVGQLVRPALPGRKAYKKTCSKDNRGRQIEGIQERDEERQNVDYVEGRNKGKQRRIKTERPETHEDVAQNIQEEGSIESLSSSNSDIQLNSGLEVGEGSNNLSRRHSCPRPGCSRTSITNLNAQSPRPATRSMSSASPQPSIQTRSTPLSPQRLSSRSAAEDSNSFSSPRQPDPFWVKVRTEAAARRSSQSHHTQTHIPTLTNSELGDEEEEEEEDQDVEDGGGGGNGVLEVMSQTMTLAVVPPCSPFGERRMSKREKNRIRCLRRRQRRRERWRQSQQESRQVNETLASACSI